MDLDDQLARCHVLVVKIVIPATEGKGFRGRCDVIVGRS